PLPGKAYELWIIDAKLGAPRSLGVIGLAPRAESLAGYDRAVVENATYAVTFEPPGGSTNIRRSRRSTIRAGRADSARAGTIRFHRKSTGARARESSRRWRSVMAAIRRWP